MTSEIRVNFKNTQVFIKISKILKTTQVPTQLSINIPNILKFLKIISNILKFLKIISNILKFLTIISNILKFLTIISKNRLIIRKAKFKYMMVNNLNETLGS